MDLFKISCHYDQLFFRGKRFQRGFLCSHTGLKLRYNHCQYWHSSLDQKNNANHPNLSKATKRTVFITVCSVWARSRIIEMFHREASAPRAETLESSNCARETHWCIWTHWSEFFPGSIVHTCRTESIIILLYLQKSLIQVEDTGSCINIINCLKSSQARFLLLSKWWIVL
jgi:hypothetical protein